MDLKKPVSGRELAQLTGQSEGAVRKAVNRGSIVKGYTSDKKFIPAIACEEWGKNILPEFLPASKKQSIKKPSTIKKSTAKPKQIVKKTPTKKPTIKKPQPKRKSANEIIEEIIEEDLPKVKSINFDEDDIEEEVDEKVSKPEAERVASILKTKILQIALKEKQGQLVPIEKVNSVLYGYGQEIRNTFEALPAQIIDKIRACDSRHSALRIFDDAIFDALNLLADIENREF